MNEDLTRRRVIGTAAAVGAAGVLAPALAACGGDGTGSSAPATGSSGTAGEVRVKAADIPEGGGTVVGEVVVVKDGSEVRAFSAVCPHQGCLVDSVADGAISCPCHGSQFSTADGGVIQGPATRGLAVETATVEGDEVVVTVA
jgi:Rieske Fe-S protein